MKSSSGYLVLEVLQEALLVALHSNHIEFFILDKKFEPFEIFVALKASDKYLHAVRLGQEPLLPLERLVNTHLLSKKTLN